MIDEVGAELLIARLTLAEVISAFALKVRTAEFDPAEFARLRACLRLTLPIVAIGSSGCSTLTLTAPEI